MDLKLTNENLNEENRLLQKIIATKNKDKKFRTLKRACNIRVERAKLETAKEIFEELDKEVWEGSIGIVDYERTKTKFLKEKV